MCISGLLSSTDGVFAPYNSAVMEFDGEVIRRLESLVLELVSLTSIATLFPATSDAINARRRSLGNYRGTQTQQYWRGQGSCGIFACLAVGYRKPQRNLPEFLIDLDAS